MRVVRYYVLVRTGNASKRGSSVVGLIVLVVGHRLKARFGRLFRRCDCAVPLLKVIRCTADAAACHGVLYREEGWVAVRL